MKYTITQIQENLASSKKRLNEVVTYGNAVISKHDLRNGYDADFYLNKIPILANSVKFWEDKLNTIQKNQLSLF